MAQLLEDLDPFFGFESHSVDTSDPSNNNAYSHMISFCFEPFKDTFLSKVQMLIERGTLESVTSKKRAAIHLRIFNSKSIICLIDNREGANPN